MTTRQIKKRIEKFEKGDNDFVDSNIPHIYPRIYGYTINRRKTLLYHNADSRVFGECITILFKK